MTDSPDIEDRYDTFFISFKEYEIKVNWECGYWPWSRWCWNGTSKAFDQMPEEDWKMIVDAMHLLNQAELSGAYLGVNPKDLLEKILCESPILVK